MKKFKTYKAIEFAEEPSFAAWILHQDAQAHTFWQSFLSENPEKEQEIEKAKQILYSIRIKEKTIDQSKIDKLWNQIDSKTQGAPKSAIVKTISPKKNNRRYLIPAIAASLLLLSLAWWNFSNKNQFVESQYAESKSISLPDGSTVFLNAGSSLAYNSDKFKETRILQLEGEAFFSVQKGSNFKVETRNGTVEVLGTSFNVNDRLGLKVDCYSGKVRVNSTNQKNTILTKNMGVHYYANQEVSYVFSNETPKWQEGIFEFKNVPLNQVFEELERQYDVSIDGKDTFSKTMYNGFFTNENLDSALFSICWPMRLKSEINGKQIKITTE